MKEYFNKMDNFDVIVCNSTEILINLRSLDYKKLQYLLIIALTNVISSEVPIDVGQSTFGVQKIVTVFAACTFSNSFCIKFSSESP